MKNVKATLIASLLVAMTFAVEAATFSVLCDGRAEKISKGCSIKLSGQIESGDAERLRTTIQRRLPEGWRYHTLLLDSPGGSIRAAIEIAAVVRQSLMDTRTFRLPDDLRANWDPKQYRWKCVSACFLVWVAGADRGANRAMNGVPGTFSDLGLHRPYLDKATYAEAPEKVAAIQQQVTQATTEYLQREQVPQSLIQKMLQHASTQVYWLTHDDEEISDRSPWFEEMMISRCGYDPSYVRDYMFWYHRFVVENLTRKAGKFEKPIENEPDYKRYIAWRQNYNDCEYANRSAAQASIRK